MAWVFRNFKSFFNSDKSSKISFEKNILGLNAKYFLSYSYLLLSMYFCYHAKYAFKNMYISIDILISKKIVYSTKEQLYEKTIENIFITV